MTNSKSTMTSPRRAIPRAQTLGLLRVVYPRELATDIEVGEELLVGREEEAGITAIPHPTVSRRHATLRWDAARSSHFLSDHDSHNGTHIDGTQAPASTPHAVELGSVIRFGDVLAVLDEWVEEQDNSVDRAAIPGASAPARRLRAQIARAAADPSPALLTGETGTGKEVVAGELHRLSGRRGPLLSVNCAALGGQLVESELFGHVKGAFTGATGDHPGLFRAAAGGSLFLDEIGDLPLDLQPKLLRAIEAREVRAVGSTSSHQVDVRVLAATNRDLQDMVATGTFRRDLYARISLWLVNLPRLRDRVSDLFVYLDAIFDSWLAERDRTATPLDFDADAAESLMLHPWEDNLRGLVRLVHELAELSGPIGAGALPDWLLTEPVAPSAAAPPAPKPDAPTRDELLALLRDNDGSVRAVAKQLQRHRNQVYRWMRALGINRDEL